MLNPYPYSEDNKRYQTWNYYTKTNYGHRLYKVPLDADFTCPNRDGTCGTGGCVFCAGGSSSFPGHTSDDLWQQYLSRKPVFQRKWPEGRPLAYFQSYSNTYAPLEHLKELFEPFVSNDEIAGLFIATRTDCLSPEITDYLVSLSERKEIWLELGLQSIHDRTLAEMNRGHDFSSFQKQIDVLSQTPLKISVHIINGWPGETMEMQLETARTVGHMPIHALKIHMLHVLKGTPLGKRYESEPFPLLSKQEYTELTARQLTEVRPDIAIERITGDGLPDQLIAPEWTIKKISVINDIDKVMARNDWWQGKYY
ncbi:MAG: TIGR01212 family radical SAM protein [Erysipelotrichaceae bacterium]|nr:TIGR01212 family radical SAM protein [Erysipelotrichaceae bacterium]